ncbi:MAG: YafY family protein [Coprobacillus sp.]
MKGRLFEILYYLLEKKNTTAQELAEYFEVSVRTIYRDIDKLLVAKIPIQTTQGKNGGISIDENYVLDKTLLSSQEQDHILMAMQGMESLRVEDKQLTQRMKTLFQKESQDWLEIDFSYWRQDNEIQEKFDLIKETIFNHIIIEFDYMNMQGIQSHRMVYPIKIFFKAQAWYLQGYDISKQDYRIYKFTRIHKLINTKHVFDQTLTDIPQIHQYQEDSQMIDVVFLFDKSLGSFVYDEFSYQSIEDTQNGYIVKTTLPYHSWLISFILSFGHGVEVIEPLSLREEIVDEIQSMNHKYF